MKPLPLAAMSGAPEGWATNDFDASDWPEATVHAADVGPKEGYDEIE